MQLIIKSDNQYYLIIPIDLITQKEDIIITKIKQLFLKYNQKYHLLEPGFYEVNVYNHHLVGTILSIEKIDSFDFSEEVDLRIIIKSKIKIYLKIIDPTDFPNYKPEIDLDTLSYQDYLKLIEHSTLIIEQKKFSLREL